MSELRAHFPERDAYLDRLAQHYADGLLDDAGFEARRDMLLRATTHGEMLGAFDGLPRPRYAGQDRGGRRGMGRRGLIIGGAVAAGAVVLAGSGAVIDLGGPGQAQSVSLIFTGRGNPALEVVVGEGDVRTGTVTYDLDDNLIALEEG